MARTARLHMVRTGITLGSNHISTPDERRSHDMQDPGTHTRTGRRAIRPVAALIAATALALLANPSANGQAAGEVWRMRLDGVVDPFVADYLSSGIADAADAGAAAALIEIDTPGGLDSSMREITQAILNARVPVLCYVAPQGARAASAGAFVLMSCPIAAMAPGTNVGAATPVGLNGAVGSEKAVNDAAAYMRGLAEQRGRNADVAESFVRDATSISAEQALDDDVIDLVAASTADLLRRVDGDTVTLSDGTDVTLATAGATVVDRSMGAFVGVLHGLLDPNLAFIFFWLGIALIVLELIVPGHIFSGTVGTILLILAIVSFGLLPVQLIGIALLVASAVFMLVELKVPGFGVWGILGLVCLALGGWFLYDRSGGVSVSPAVIVPVAASIGVFFFFVVTKVMRLRDMPPAKGPGAIIGKEGVVIGRGLDPDGIVRVASEEWRAVVDGGGSVRPGGAIRVTRLDGLVLTVEPVAEEHEQDDAHDERATGTTPVEGGRT
jgi:membrane-bound serine protease (ClpP class)